MIATEYRRVAVLTAMRRRFSLPRRDERSFHRPAWGDSGYLKTLGVAVSRGRKSGKIGVRTPVSFHRKECFGSRTGWNCLNGIQIGADATTLISWAAAR